MNNKRISVGVLCAALLAFCVVSLAAYISAKQQAVLKKAAEILQLRKELKQAIQELSQLKERDRVLLEELERKTEIAEAARKRALSRFEFLTAPRPHD